MTLQEICERHDCLTIQLAAWCFAAMDGEAVPLSREELRFIPNSLNGPGTWQAAAAYRVSSAVVKAMREVELTAVMMRTK